MKPLTIAQFGTQLGAMLRDVPYGTTADLTDYAVAFWDGSKRLCPVDQRAVVQRSS